MGYVLNDLDVADQDRGIAISTMGKVIKRGWDWLGLAPGEAASVTGLIEVPALAEVLTLNKADFIRTGQKGATFLAYRKAIQEPVAQLLVEWGNAPRPSASRRPRTRSLERDLRSVLADLSGDFPLIGTLVERRPGGQRRLALGGDPGSPGKGVTPALEADFGADLAAATPSTDGTSLSSDEAVGQETGPPKSADEPGGAERTGDASLPGGTTRKKPATYGLAIRFESRPNHPALGRLLESTVWVNEAHPAYERALASRSDGYHVALTVALTLAPLAVEPARVQEFVSTFLGCWGDAGTRGGRKKRS
jgi:hypothetical protein